MKNQNRRIIIILMLLASMYLHDTGIAQETDTDTPPKKPDIRSINPVNPALYPITYFRKYISAVDGNRCPMYPSCSQFSIEAFQKHGLLMGWIMTCDRLMRCGRDEAKVSPQIWINGKTRCYDPVVANDFWWKK